MKNSLPKEAQLEKENILTGMHYTNSYTQTGKQTITTLTLRKDPK